MSGWCSNSVPGREVVRLGGARLSTVRGYCQDPTASRLLDTRLWSARWSRKSYNSCCSGSRRPRRYAAQPMSPARPPPVAPSRGPTRACGVGTAGRVVREAATTCATSELARYQRCEMAEWLHCYPHHSSLGFFRCVKLWGLGCGACLRAVNRCCALELGGSLRLDAPLSESRTSMLAVPRAALSLNASVHDWEVSSAPPLRAQPRRCRGGLKF